ncbi:acyl-CoA dehydrogenase [Reticulomyxa filosa]|uniref:Acyl-CoA dehydrogenase n=1 Tax=Reticulomyxa filosa TaxID=46433 RepID=X6NTA2_RETFI|nr:acyl-CoA dehydrogenase [Reticulomyxa filosa]|eukprot:ETO29183.1 acyl-CoA dehydrogenase [Reticulomyxa filosa]
MATEKKGNTPTLLDFENQVSPYYNEGHAAFRKHVRVFVEKEILPYYQKWEQDGKIPRDLLKKVAAHGGIFMFPWGLGETEWKGYKWDPFYSIVFAQEMVKAGGVNSLWIHNMRGKQKKKKDLFPSLCNKIMCFLKIILICEQSLPPVLFFGKNAIHKQCVREVVSGEKVISLAISELRGGSDVAQIATQAVLVTDPNDNKQYYIINGGLYYINCSLLNFKKKILTRGKKLYLICTNKLFFLLCLNKKKKKESIGLHLGVGRIILVYVHTYTKNKQPNEGSEMSETAQVTFKDVKVPVENVIGEVNEGFKIVMYGFNNERFIIACSCVAAGRLCVEESIQWARERETFGKKLSSHQVIRHKIAEMSRLVLATHAFLERTAYQIQHDRLGQKDKSIPRNIALLKVQSSRMLQQVVIEASQIFGGRSYVRTGRGAVIDRIYRIVRSQAIAGGSEEILLDFVTRQAKL